MLLRYVHNHIPGRPVSSHRVHHMFNTRKTLVFFSKLFYHKADREQSHLYVSFTASGLWSKADLRTYSHPSSPLAQPRSLLDEYASKRELGKGPVLAWERIFKAKSTLRLRFGFYWFLVSQLPLMLLKSADFQMYPQLASYSKCCSIAEVTAHLYSPP